MNQTGRLDAQDYFIASHFRVFLVNHDPADLNTPGVCSVLVVKRPEHDFRSRKYIMGRRVGTAYLEHSDPNGMPELVHEI